MVAVLIGKLASTNTGNSKVSPDVALLNDPALVKNAFEGYDLNKIVELINNDINAINLL